MNKPHGLKGKPSNNQKKGPKRVQLTGAMYVDLPAIEKIFGTKELAKQAANEVVREWWNGLS